MNSSKTKAVHDQYGDGYLRWKSWGAQSFGELSRSDASYFAAEISRTKNRFPKGAKVLEIGFGNGSFLAYAKGKGWAVFGTEVNSNLVQIGTEFGFNVSHSEDLSFFPDGAFDLVVAFDVLEHIPQDTLLIFLLEIRRILKSGGFFIAKFPNGDSPFSLPYQNGDVTHTTVIGTGKVRYFAEKANMELVFVGGEAQPIIGTSFNFFIYRIITLPIKMLINVFVRMIFLHGAKIAFCSSNSTLIYRR